MKDIVVFQSLKMYLKIPTYFPKVEMSKSLLLENTQLKIIVYQNYKHRYKIQICSDNGFMGIGVKGGLLKIKCLVP